MPTYQLILSFSQVHDSSYNPLRVIPAYDPVLWDKKMEQEARAAEKKRAKEREAQVSDSDSEEEEEEEKRPSKKKKKSAPQRLTTPVVKNEPVERKGASVVGHKRKKDDEEDDDGDDVVVVEDKDKKRKVTSDPADPVPESWIKLLQSIKAQVDRKNKKADIPHIQTMIEYIVAGIDLAKTDPTSMMTFTGSPVIRKVVFFFACATRQKSRDMLHELMDHMKMRVSSLMNARSHTPEQDFF